MAKGAYIGVSSVARKVKKMYIGVGGVARKVKKAYIGVNGVARLWWSGTSWKTLVCPYTSGTNRPYLYLSSESEAMPSSSDFNQISSPYQYSYSGGTEPHLLYDKVHKCVIAMPKASFTTTTAPSINGQIYVLKDGATTWTSIGNIPSTKNNNTNTYYWARPLDKGPTITDDGEVIFYSSYSTSTSTNLCVNSFRISSSYAITDLVCGKNYYAAYQGDGSRARPEKINGYYIVGGKNTDGTKGQVSYTSDLNNSWTYMSVASNSSNDRAFICGFRSPIHYYNGYWYYCITSSGTSNRSLFYIKCASSLSDLGTSGNSKSVGVSPSTSIYYLPIYWNNGSLYVNISNASSVSYSNYIKSPGLWQITPSTSNSDPALTKLGNAIDSTYLGKNGTCNSEIKFDGKYYYTLSQGGTTSVAALWYSLDLVTWTAIDITSVVNGSDGNQALRIPA